MVFVLSDDLRAAAEGEEWSDDDEPSDHEQEHEFYDSLVSRKEVY